MARRRPRLTTVAVNPRRGTGSTLTARLDLLRRAGRAVHPDGPTVYLTAGGFVGCATAPGDGTGEGNFTWPGGLDLGGLDAELGRLAARLPGDVALGV